MQADPILEWQRLTGHYREIGDDELRELAADFADLTETAQQALRSEMRSRGLGDPKAPETARRHRMRRQRLPLPTLNQSLAPNIPSFTPGTLAACPSSFPMRPTARTTRARTTTHGRPSSATVIPMNKRRNSLQRCSRPESKAGFNSRSEFGRRYARVLVAADQLDQARAIAARPIPREIVEESQDERARFRRRHPVPSAAPPIRFSKPSIQRILAVRAMRRAMDRIGRNLRSASTRGGTISPLNGKSRPATGQLSPQGE